MKNFRLMAILGCAVIISVAVAAKSLCSREINATNGGQFGLGYSGHGEAYCAVSSFSEPIVMILGAFVVVWLFQLTFRRRRRSRVTGEQNERRSGGIKGDTPASSGDNVPPPANLR